MNQLTKYERANLLAARAAQLNQNEPTTIDTTNYDCSLDIATQEMYENKFPAHIFIERLFPNGVKQKFSYYDLEDPYKLSLIPKLEQEPKPENKWKNIICQSFNSNLTWNWPAEKNKWISIFKKLKSIQFDDHIFKKLNYSIPFFKDFFMLQKLSTQFNTEYKIYFNQQQSQLAFFELCDAFTEIERGEHEHDYPQDLIFIIQFLMNNETEKLSIFDPFSGWLDRAIGALALNATYTGIESNPTLEKPYYEFSKFMLANKLISPNQLDLNIGDPTMLKLGKQSFDFIFSTPPIYDMPRERYQSQILFPATLKSLTYLKPDGYLVYKLGAEDYQNDYIIEFIKFMKKNGMEYLGILGRVVDHDVENAVPFFVFHKPSMSKKMI